MAPGFSESLRTLEQQGPGYDRTVHQKRWAVLYVLERQPTSALDAIPLGENNWAIRSEGPFPLVLFYEVDEASRTVILKRAAMHDRPTG